MKIRYGKPIIATSLVGQVNVPFVYSSSNTMNAWFVSATNHTVGNNVNLGTEQTFNQTQSHKYFVALKTSVPSINAINCNATGASSESYYTDTTNNIYTCKIYWTGSSSSRVLRGYYTSNGTAIVPTSGTNDWVVLLDLTELGLDALTAQQFYDKYKKYLSALATGKSIVIDSKSGNISYAKPVSLYSLWGDQSVLTATAATSSGNYVYLAKDGYSCQSVWNSNTSLTDFNTPITSGHKYILVVKQDRTNAGFNIVTTANGDKWRWTTASGTFYTGSNYYITYSYYVADADVTLKNFYQGGSHTSVLSWDLFVDLTDTFGAGSEPSAADFYTLYKGYLLDISSGEREVVGHAQPHIKLIPEIYQQVEYIQSGGTQYINTGYIAKVNNVNLELDMAWTGNTLGAFESFMGFMYSTSTVNPRMALHKYSSKLMFGANATTTSGVAPVKNERFVYRGDFTSGAQKLYKNGTQIATNSTTYDFSTNTCPVYIFARYCPNGMNYSSMRVYRARIYEGTALKMDFIPCYRKSDSVIGLYDTVTKTFFTNTGSGTFTKGNNTNILI